MSLAQVKILVTVLSGLFIWCAIYARVIASKRVRSWYLRHNKTWFMVVLGVIWIFIALAILSLYGLFSFWHLGIVMLCASAAGAPMIFGQYMQQTNDHARYAAAKKRREKSGEPDGED